ncbi:phenylacetate--CoA ligase family protein [Glutamicibacter creatinolyticus]|uniref:phenylacetate--CoA ligase family protein n=1 Tax=Glutamicibacter creatinolyticus TaxID=162496 RepID=UPI0037C1B1A7
MFGGKLSEVIALSKRGVFNAKTLVFQRSVRRASSAIAYMEALSEAEIVRFQDDQCLAIARHAYETTDFYQDFYESHGFSQKDMCDPDVFVELPALTKDHLREQSTRFRSSTADPRRFLPSSTGGSTGQPLKVYHDAAAPTAAFWWTVYRWAGAGPWTDVGFVQRERREASTVWKESLQWWPTQRVFLDSRMMDPGSIQRFVSTLQKRRDFIIIGYVGAVVELAEYISRHRLNLEGLRSVSVTAAPLSGAVREFLQSVFRVPVLNQYRSAEVPWIAAQCRQGDGLHVLASHRHVGLHTSADARGAKLDLLVTDFANRAFPLVKYAIGDQSRPLAGRCPCGNGFPRIEPIDGRVTDTLRLPDGSAITGGLTGLFNKHPDAVRQFQIVQRPDSSLLLRCVPTSPDSVTHIEEAREELNRIVRAQVSVSYELVEQIPHDAGKSRIIKSELPKESLH